MHGKSFAGVGSDDAYADAGKRMADGAAFGSHLAKIGGAKIVGVDGDDRRAFRAAVALERADAEMIFESLCDAFGQFLRPGHHDAQAAEGFGRAAAGVGGHRKRGGEGASVRSVSLE